MNQSNRSLIKPTVSVLCGVFLFVLSGCSNHRDTEVGLPVKEVTRHWIGPEYWSNPVMNWQLSDGRIECIHGGLVNEVHSLTHQLCEGDGNFVMRVKVGSMDREIDSVEEAVFAGFKFGAVGHRNDYRSNIYHDIESGFAEELMREPPLRAGITSRGELVINSKVSDIVLAPTDLRESELRLEVSYSGSTANIQLSVDREKGETQRWNLK